MVRAAERAAELAARWLKAPPELECPSLLVVLLAAQRRSPAHYWLLADERQYPFVL